MAELKNFPVGDIHVVKNVRTTFDPEGLKKLAASIKSNGVLQPLLVRRASGRYELVAGERRLRAARMARLTEVPAYVLTLSDAKVIEAQLVENTHREEMNVVDEAFGVRELYGRLGTQQAVADALGQTDFYVGQMVMIAELPSRALAALRDGRLSKTVAYEVAKLRTRALVVAAVAAVVPERKGAAPTSIKRAKRLISQLLRDEEAKGQSPLKLRTREPSSGDRRDYYKFWRYWLQRFNGRDFEEWKRTCNGRYDEHTCADAVFVMMKQKEADAVAAQKLRGGGSYNHIFRGGSPCLTWQ